MNKLNQNDSWLSRAFAYSPTRLGENAPARRIVAVRIIVGSAPASRRPNSAISSCETSVTVPGGMNAHKHAPTKDASMSFHFWRDQLITMPNFTVRDPV